LRGLVRTIAVAAIAAFIGTGPAPAQQAQQAAPNWKDRAEYDLVQASDKETNPTKKLELLNTWKEKYPSTELKLKRFDDFWKTYQALNQPMKMYELAKEFLAGDPSNVLALYRICLIAPLLPKPTAEDLATLDKAAKGLVASVETTYAPDKKPQAMTEAAWKQERVGVEAVAYRTEGWVASKKQENDRAEAAFRKTLELNPNDAEVAYWLGTLIIAEKKPEKSSEAIFFIARAATYDGPGALVPQMRATVNTYLENKLYTGFHGSKDGLDDLRKLAKAQALPPAGFKVKSAGELAVEKEEEFKKSNPMLALWRNIKTELTGAGGQAYWDNMKGALIPGDAVPGVTKLKGKLVSQKPAKAPKELVLALSDATTPEVTLVLDEPMRAAAEPGTEISFEGVAANFTKEPFMVTFDVEKAKVTGWPAPPPPAKKAPVGKKKAAAAKK
jgi:tetratricopeptide (TPR) repeat protein